MTQPEPRRIGLLGGSFDPVHNAHLALGRAALDGLALDELRWVPAGAPWQKTRRITPAAQRADMVRLAIADEPRFRFEPCELKREGPSYSIDTVHTLQVREPGTQWFLLLGQDQLARLHTWHRWRELVATVRLAVANRGDDAPRIPPELADADVRMDVVSMPPSAISATEIRARVADGRDISALVPPGVARYIDEHGLYRDPLRS